MEFLRRLNFLIIHFKGMIFTREQKSSKQGRNIEENYS